jgi:hypothetical protein
LINIPDGGTKEKPTSLKATDTAAVAAKAAGDKSKSSATTVASSPEVDQLVERIVIQGEKVRDLKANKSNPKVNEI